MRTKKNKKEREKEIENERNENEKNKVAEKSRSGKVVGAKKEELQLTIAKHAAIAAA